MPGCSCTSRTLPLSRCSSELESMCPQDDGWVAKLLVEAGTKDLAVGSPLAVLVEDQEHVAAFKDYSPASQQQQQQQQSSQAQPEPKGASPAHPQAACWHSQVTCSLNSEHVRRVCQCLDNNLWNLGCGKRPELLSGRVSHQGLLG